MATTTAESPPMTPRLIFGRFRFWLFMVGLVVILTGGDPEPARPGRRS